MLFLSTRPARVDKMIRRIFINGRVDTFFVVEDEAGGMHPLVDALKEQADRIEALERQNEELLKQGALLLNILDMTASTSDMIIQVLRNLQSEGEDPS